MLQLYQHHRFTYDKLEYEYNEKLGIFLLLDLLLNYHEQHKF